MRKEVYILLGIAALILSIGLGALHFYKKAHEKEEEYARVSDELLYHADSQSDGPVGASIKLVEFLDPECEACKAMHPVIKKVRSNYEGKIRYVVRYAPFHKSSVFISSALEAARVQNKFWEALDVIFKEQPHWADDHEKPNTEAALTSLKAIGIDLDKLKKDMNDPAIVTRINRDYSEAKLSGVHATPGIFVNGQLLIELDQKSLEKLIEDELHRG